MPTSTNNQDVTTAVVAAPGTSVAAGLALPDNCHTMWVFNPSNGAAWVGLGAPGAALSAANATRILAGSGFSVPVGSASQRAGATAYRFDAAIATTLEITYYNGSEV